MSEYQKMGADEHRPGAGSVMPIGHSNPGDHVTACSRFASDPTPCDGVRGENAAASPCQCFQRQEGARGAQANMLAWHEKQIRRLEGASAFSDDHALRLDGQLKAHTRSAKHIRMLDDVFQRDRASDFDSCQCNQARGHACSSCDASLR